MEPFWQKFKSPIAPIETKRIISHLITRMSSPSDMVFDDMTNMCSFMGGASQNPMSDKTHEDWF